MEFNLLTHLTKLSLFSNVVLNGQQQVNYISMTAAWFSSPEYWHLKAVFNLAVLASGTVCLLYTAV